MSGMTAKGESRFVENGGVRIHYKTFGGAGAGRRTLLFHAGAGTDQSIWDRQAAHFEDRCHVIAMDHRGSGSSDRPDEKYSASSLVSDLDAVVSAEGIERFVLVGYSMGGLIAQRYLNDHPERLEGLVLLNCTLGSSVPDTVLPEREVTNTFLFGMALSDEDVVDAAMEFHFEEGFEAAHPEAARAYRQMFTRNVEGIRLQIPVLASDEPLIGDLAGVTTPIMAIFSRDDVVTPAGNAEVLKSHLPRARVELLDGHHASMLIYPDAVNRLLDEFLRSL